MTRREFHGVVAGSLVAAPFARLGARQKPDSKIAGVRLGAQSYSFRDRLQIDPLIQALVASGLSYCELWSSHIETRETISGATGLSQREARRKWRLEVPLDYFAGIRDKFDRAGVTLTAYNLSFTNDWTDEEIARGFEMAKALGVNVITASSQVSTASRIYPHAKRTGITVAFHNHSVIRADEFATPDDFATATKGREDKLAINLDIGHFVAAGFDPLAYLDQHHDRIVSLHIKDRTRKGEDRPFGQGEVPIVAVLQRLRDRKWDIPANLEFEYRGNAVEEVRKSFEYCKKALLG
jgi:sugar phosphate isomerase/epimerase